MRFKELSTNDLKELIVAVHPSGSNWKTISKQFDVHHCAVRRIIHKWKTLKTTDSLPRSPYISECNKPQGNDAIFKEE
uniref:Sleeping Beauty transposase HTH domain-containing protein n=1 Tax=Pundamilia nyererei TaxID=303518 RepID=A0A3B4FVY7_9CICH